MNGIFIVCERVGDGKSTLTAWRPFLSGAVFGWAGLNTRDYYVCNAFDPDQTKLDAIADDPRMEFSFPIDVDGNKLSYSDAFEVPPATRGKLIAWCAKTYGAEFGQAIAANAKNRRFVAEMIMREASGIPTADPLNGWRCGWDSPGTGPGEVLDIEIE